MKGKKLFFLRRFWQSRAIGKSNFLASPKLRGKSSPNATHSPIGVQSITGTITTNYAAASLQETPKRKSQLPITRKNGVCLQPRGLTSSTLQKSGSLPIAEHYWSEQQLKLTGVVIDGRRRTSMRYCVWCGRELASLSLAKQFHRSSSWQPWPVSQLTFRGSVGRLGIVPFFVLVMIYSLFTWRSKQISYLVYYELKQINNINSRVFFKDPISYCVSYVYRTYS